MTARGDEQRTRHPNGIHHTAAPAAYGRPMLRRCCLLTAALALGSAAPAAAAPTPPVALDDAPALRLTLAEPWNVSSIRPAGDVSGDGRTDLLVVVDKPGYRAAVVVFGGRHASAVNLNAIGADGYYILNVQFIAPGDDVNGDGRPDFFDTRTAPDGTTTSVVIYGKGTTSTIDRRTLTPAQGAVYDPAFPQPDPWGSDNSVGDFNGDGIRDQVYTSSPGRPNALKVAFGSAGAPPSPSGPGYSIPYGFGIATPCANYPSSVVVLGDVTGDGRDDIGIAGEPSPAYGPRHDKACVVKGRTSTTDVDLTRLAATGDGFTVSNGEGRLTSLAGAYAASAGRLWRVGDVDGDGTDDLAVETPTQYRYLQPGLYVFPGGPRTANIDATKPGTPHLRLTTSEPLRSVLGIPDVTGDGRDEIALNTALFSPPYASTPVYAVGGRPLSGAQGLDDLGATALKLLPPGGTLSKSDPNGGPGDSVFAAGDVDGDGKADTGVYTATAAGPAQLETIRVIWGALR